MARTDHDAENTPKLHPDVANTASVLVADRRERRAAEAAKSAAVVKRSTAAESAELPPARTHSAYESHPHR